MNIHEYVIRYKECLLLRDTLLDLFAVCDRVKAEFVEDKLVGIDTRKLVVGRIVEYEKELYGVIDPEGKTPDASLVKITDVTSPLLRTIDKITLQPGDLANIDVVTETTVGKFILNYLLLVEPFGALFPYINKEVKVDKIEKDIVRAALTDKITIDQVKSHYLPNLYYIGHFTELWVPGYSPNTIVPSEAIMARKKELLEEYKDRLTDPVIMSAIEDELIGMLRAEVKNDPSYGFYGASDKLIHTCMKTMLIASGIISYQENGKTQYKFIDKSLDDEWEIGAFSEHCNEVRKGIHQRSIATAKGGEITEFIRRVFQDSKITEKDCHTTRTYDTVLKKDHVSKYLYANILNKGDLLTLTPDNIEQYIGKLINIRSPMYCETHDGYCQVCMGKLMEIRDTKFLATIISRIGSAFLSASMKAFHGTKHKSIDISNLNNFLA